MWCWLLRSLLFNSTYLWPSGYLRGYCLIQHICEFPVFLLVLISNFIPFWLESLFSLFFNLFRLVMWLTYGVACRTFHVYFLRMCILLGGVFYKLVTFSWLILLLVSCVNFSSFFLISSDVLFQLSYFQICTFYLLPILILRYSSETFSVFSILIIVLSSSIISMWFLFHNS